MTTLNSTQMMDMVETQVDDMMVNPEKYRGYNFPVPWFMRETGGWGKNHLCYVTGKAKAGKTSMLVTALTKLGIDGVKVVCVTLEEGLFSLGGRVLTNINSELNRKQFRDADFTPVHRNSLHLTAETARKFSIVWTDETWSPASIMALCEQVQPQVLVLDYLQMLDDGKPVLNKTQTVEGYSNWLARLSKGQNKKIGPICVIAACQLNDQGDPLWTRAVQRDADIVCEVRAKQDPFGNVLPSRRDLVLTYNRHGAPGMCEVVYNGGRSLIGELAGQGYGQGINI